MNKIKFNLFDSFCFLALFISLFFLIRSVSSTSVFLFAQPENYGDIKLEIRDQHNTINEKHHFLVNTRHYIYSKKFNSDLSDKKLLFYLDRRHKTFSSKGITSHRKKPLITLDKPFGHGN